MHINVIPLQLIRDTTFRNKIRTQETLDTHRETNQPSTHPSPTTAAPVPPGRASGAAAWRPAGGRARCWPVPSRPVGAARPPDAGWPSRDTRTEAPPCTGHGLSWKERGETWWLARDVYSSV